MSLDERLKWLIIGCVIGFILGYIVRALQGIKEELVEVETILKDEPRKRNDHGFMRYPVIADFALLVVVLMTVWAAFASQHATNQVHEQQKAQARITSCTNEYLAKTIEALNERTTYTLDQAQTNVKLQEAQKNYLKFLTHIPPYPEVERAAALRDYVARLSDFVEVSIKNTAKVSANPYPTPTEFSDCVHRVLKEN